MKYLSVCSGIEAASVAWEPLGWTPLAFSEIEPFPSAVLAHHWPDVPNLGDFTSIVREGLSNLPDVLIGGTPCQAFSVAGLRNSLEDHRGNLTLEFVRLADRLDDGQLIVVWENVPGVLSTKDNAFGCFLGAVVGADTELVAPGKRWGSAGVVVGPTRTAAWRVLDAQYFGVAQRRKRLFVVASAREGFDPVSVLLESEGVCRDTPPSRESLQGASAGIGCGTSIGDDDWPADVAATLRHENGSPGYANQDIFSQKGANLVPAAVVMASGQDPPIVVAEPEPQASAVRRLTPRECERLQGFPDDHTRIPWRKKAAEDCPDGPRYKACGNSMAVPVIRWIGRRIEMVANLDG